MPTLLVFMCTFLSAQKSEEIGNGTDVITIQLKPKDGTMIPAVKNLVKAPIRVAINYKTDSSKNEFYTLDPLGSVDIKNFDFQSGMKKLSIQYFLGNQKNYTNPSNLALPFQQGKKYKVLQGNNSDFTHHQDYNKYAIDFQMPIGETIVAAYDGVVVYIEDGFSKGGNEPDLRNFGNYIILYHPQYNIFTEYYHISKDGALVELNQEVKTNTPIALSGNVGYSTEPHLHFNVFVPSPKKFSNVSIPYTFKEIGDSEKIKKGDKIKKN